LQGIAEGQAGIGKGQASDGTLDALLQGVAAFSKSDSDVGCPEQFEVAVKPANVEFEVSNEGIATARSSPQELEEAKKATSPLGGHRFF
jgi:hypothetical protein